MGSRFEFDPRVRRATLREAIERDKKTKLPEELRPEPPAPFKPVRFDEMDSEPLPSESAQKAPEPPSPEPLIQDKKKKEDTGKTKEPLVGEKTLSDFEQKLNKLMERYEKERSAIKKQEMWANILQGLAMIALGSGKYVQPGMKFDKIDFTNKLEELARKYDQLTGAERAKMTERYRTAAELRAQKAEQRAEERAARERELAPLRAKAAKLNVDQAELNLKATKQRLQQLPIAQKLQQYRELNKQILRASDKMADAIRKDEDPEINIKLYQNSLKSVLQQAGITDPEMLEIVTGYGKFDWLGQREQSIRKMQEMQSRVNNLLRSIYRGKDLPVVTPDGKYGILTNLEKLPALLQDGGNVRP